MLVLSLVLSLVAQDPVTDLGVIDIKAPRLQPMTRVEVNTDAPLEALIVSNPASIRCGAARFSYDPYMQPRQCWIRRLPGTDLRLEAVAPSSWGENWRVDWQNCPSASGRICHMTTTRHDQIIKATFVRST